MRRRRPIHPALFSIHHSSFIIRHSPSRGLTLLELILAMMIVSLLALTLSACLRAAFKARDSALAAVGPSRAAHVALDLIARDLEAALPANGVLAGEFVGQSLGDANNLGDVVQFYALGNEPWSHDPRAAGIRSVTLSLRAADDESDDTLVLVRHVTTNLLSPQVLDPDEEVLCRRVKSVELQYLFDDGWYDTWDSTALDNMLPVAVRITLHVEPASGPPLTITRTFALPLYAASEPDPEATG